MNNKYIFLCACILALACIGYLSYSHVTKPEIAHPYYHQLEMAHQAMMGMPMNMGMMQEKDKYIGVLLYDGFTLLDAMGPIQTLSGIHGYKVVTIAKHKGQIQSEQEIGIEAQYGFSDAPKLDVLVVPGGLFGTLETAKDKETIDWVRK